MKCTDAVEVLNIQSYLPSYGETSFTCDYSEGSLLFLVLYDDENSNDLKKVEMIFKYPVFVEITSFPGPSLIDCHYNTNFLSSLVEFTKSELKDKWSTHFKDSFKFKHYGLLLLNANKRLEIVCEEVRINQ